MQVDFLFFKKQAQIFKALSHETRIAIINILAQKERSVSEILQFLSPKERTGISKHLFILKKLGIIDCKKEGTKKIYRLQAHCLLQVVHCTLQLLEKNKS